jgi:hypothetical protein
VLILFLSGQWSRRHRWRSIYSPHTIIAIGGGLPNLSSGALDKFGEALWSPVWLDLSGPPNKSGD